MNLISKNRSNVFLFLSIFTIFNIPQSLFAVDNPLGKDECQIIIESYVSEHFTFKEKAQYKRFDNVVGEKFILDIEKSVSKKMLPTCEEKPMTVTLNKLKKQFNNACNESCNAESLRFKEKPSVATDFSQEEASSTCQDVCYDIFRYYEIMEKGHLVGYRDGYTDGRKDPLEAAAPDCNGVVDTTQRKDSPIFKDPNFVKTPSGGYLKNVGSK